MKLCAVTDSDEQNHLIRASAELKQGKQSVVAAEDEQLDVRE